MTTLQRTWTWEFDSPPEAVWPLLADTARINAVAGLGKHDVEEVAQPDGRVRYYATLRKGPFTIRWEERPVEWVADSHFVHSREFLNGPFRTLTAELGMDRAGNGSRAEFTVTIVPRRGLGWLLRAVGVMGSVGRTFEPIIESVRRHLAGVQPDPFVTAPPRTPADLRARVHRLADSVEKTPHGHGLAHRLADWILAAQDLDLFKIRPLAIARHWGVGERETVECCLQAVKAGLLFLRWDILCPNCRGAKETAGALDALPDGAHCPTCNIDYGRDFSRNVELSFHPSPGVRDVIDGEYCFFAPMTTPHVKVQQTIGAGERRVLEARLPHGLYRLRLLHGREEASIDWVEGGFPEVVAVEDGLRVGEAAREGEIVLVNRTAAPRTMVVESREWLRDALTADRVTSLQAFRDLFADDVLRPGDEVAVRRVALMFTDLKGSTDMYGRVGDAAAYGLVRQHFAYLAGAVRENNGAIVKTIGDAVMASFVDPADSIRAALAVQENIATLNSRAGERLVIKVGIHAGPCIAVTLNDRLDYFGSTVNMAARLQGESVGGDIVLSNEIAEDPEVAALLSDLGPVPETATIKGFGSPVAFLRIDPASRSSIPRPRQAPSPAAAVR